MSQITSRISGIAASCEKDTCDWVAVEEYYGEEEVVRTVLQEHLAHELSAELELRQPLVEAERARGRVADQRPLVE